MLGIFALVASFTSDLFPARSFTTLPLQTLQRVGQDQQYPLEADVSDHRKWVEPMNAAPPFKGSRIPNRKTWTVTCDSELDAKHSCQKAFDGDEDTFWLTKRASLHPSFIKIDLGAVRNVSGIAVLPRQDDPEDGNIAAHELYLSNDGINWDSISYGTWWSDFTEKFSGFEPTTARYLRLEAFSDATNSSLTGIAEFNIFTNDDYEYAPPAGDVGIWGPTIDTPIVPITAFVDPHTQQVVLISSKKHDNFPQTRPDFTLTVLWDPKTRALTQTKVQNTHHNMFCPGTTFDAEGRMLVTGGASGKVASIFNGSATDGNMWYPAAPMTYNRGYQSSTLTADGRIFLIGGSWGNLAREFPEERYKDGEIYDPKTNTWTFLPQCEVKPMLTNDREDYRQDNHGMLFTWKNGTVFQAGPSNEMNWYTTTGKGGVAPAGTRDPADGPGEGICKGRKAQLCGQAMMYDASEGKVLVFGGSGDYNQGCPTTAKTFVLTIGEPNTTVHAEKVQPMAYERTFAQAVIAPNGDVLVTGGQEGTPTVFNDTGAVMHVESYSAATGKWSMLARNSIVRVYHSFTLFLPDARVVSGGGGLCGDRKGCPNHFDMEIYTPPYLLNADGSLRQRPNITKIDRNEVKPGGKFIVDTDDDITTASMIRYSGTTHTVNNDERRVPLKVTRFSANQYELHVPAGGHIAIPGYWMLFVMNRVGTPSVSETVKILID